MFNPITICKRSADETIHFAAEELRRYLRMMMPDSGTVVITSDPASVGIHVGLLADFGLPGEGDPKFDDILHIEIKNKTGVIAGSNPRSVLAAVYRYLHENGCRWPRPGVEGELIPLKECADISYRHMASNRHRGLCIEGAVSYQNMLENIDWAPKVGFNAYMLEFITPYTFFDSWYQHQCNNYLSPEKVSSEEVHQRCVWLETEIKKRGLEYHAVGHAWSCEPLGIAGGGWTEEKHDIPDEIKQYLAMLDGERKIFHGVALNTNLCYTNPSARKKMTDYIADYAERNAHIDYLHVWLADSTNNHCECDECRKFAVSDLYVLLLNEIDAELTKRGILKMKITFIVYLELLWPPETHAFKNPDRFSLLFAPITRTYSMSYTDKPYEGELPGFERNNLSYLGDPAGSISFLRGWQKMFKGDSFCYEYYFWLDHCYDLGYYDIARTILQDIKCLKKLGLGGIVSDQSQRTFMPTGFPMYVLGQGLYDSDLSFDELAKDFFSTFGEDGEKCRDYMAELSRLFDPAYQRGYVEKIEWNSREEQYAAQNMVSTEAAEKLRMIHPLVNSFRPLIRKNMKNGSRCVAKSWKYLAFHAELCERMADIYIERAEGRVREAKELWSKTHTWLSLRENDVQDAFDLYAFARAVQQYM